MRPSLETLRSVTILTLGIGLLAAFAAHYRTPEIVAGASCPPGSHQVGRNVAMSQSYCRPDSVALVGRGTSAR